MIALLIDDNCENAEALQRLLHATWKIDIEELQVIIAGTLSDGLAVADQANVTILDLDLPDSGLENTIAHIGCFRPPVIVLSGNVNADESGSALSARCLAAGADHVFAKGSALGLVPSVFESMQKDILRRAAVRQQSFYDAHATG